MRKLKAFGEYLGVILLIFAVAASVVFFILAMFITAGVAIGFVSLGIDLFTFAFNFVSNLF